MTLEQSVVQRRLHVIIRAVELGNVTAACREAGISRPLFYRWRTRYERYGIAGLHPRRTKARVGRPVQVPPHVERLVLAWALSWPTWGCGRLAAQLAFRGVAQVAPSTVQRILRRAGLATRRERLSVLEAHSAESAGLLTERSRRALAKARSKTRHVHATEAGELVCLDSFYIGKLKGVGKVWQLTACDAASSYGAAHVVVAPSSVTSEQARAFLEEVLIPLYQQAGWPIQRVLTDGGSEFKGAFHRACQDLGIRHTRTKPRHAWTNGFVERLQGTVLHEHWRIEFRRRFFTRLPQLERSLQAFLEFYNHQRPHQGYRTRGRTPAELFWGAARTTS
jgi:transposase InsO family protein